ncbi:MAG TPA: hypothetical protein DCZ56_00070 [Sutterella sp.]|nr:hypothetical protein [Sutterella sp.]
MVGPEKKIARCEQKAGCVEVYGSFAVEGPERVRLLFTRPGKLKEYNEKRMVLETPEGEIEEWSAEETVRREPASLEEMFEGALSGDRRITVRVVLFLLFLAVALATGALDEIDLTGMDDDVELTE